MTMITIIQMMMTMMVMRDYDSTGTLQGMEVKENDPIEVEGGTNIEIQFSKPKATFQPSLL